MSYRQCCWTFSSPFNNNQIDEHSYVKNINHNWICDPFVWSQNLYIFLFSSSWHDWACLYKLKLPKKTDIGSASALCFVSCEQMSRWVLSNNCLCADASRGSFTEDSGNKTVLHRSHAAHTLDFKLDVQTKTMTIRLIYIATVQCSTSDMGGKVESWRLVCVIENPPAQRLSVDVKFCPFASEWRSLRAAVSLHSGYSKFKYTQLKIYKLNSI